MNYLNIVSGSSKTLDIGETFQIEVEKSEGLKDKAVWKSSKEVYVTVSETGLVTAIDAGTSIVTVTIGKYSADISIIVNKPEEIKDVYSLVLLSSESKINVGQTKQLFSVEYYKNNILQEVMANKVSYSIVSGATHASLNSNSITGISAGMVEVMASIGEVNSNKITIEVETPPINVTSIVLSVSKTTLSVGEKAIFSATVFPSEYKGDVTIEALNANEYTTLSGMEVTALKADGTTIYVAKAGNIVSNPITITVLPQVIEPISLSISISDTTLEAFETATLSYTLVPINASGSVIYEILSGNSNISISGNTVTCINEKPAVIRGKIGDVVSNSIEINKEVIQEDPYKNMSASDFYANYTIASSYIDSVYRTNHNFMSGSIEPQLQAPTLSESRPMSNGLFLRNSSSYYDDNGNTYHVVDTNGEIVLSVYKDAAYVSLEEVAAYIFAFGDVPANYTSSKTGKPASNPWGKYLRLNHSYFSGSVSQYPYEPVLPNIRGCGGEFYYYETDIGTTGTDCDPNYAAKVYNNGTTITRGAARIVYSRYDKNEDNIIDINEKYLFYTYNHYNDFQEYLNYYGGWGKMFGNITGGGSISSTSNYNPTSYEQTIKMPFLK